MNENEIEHKQEKRWISIMSNSGIKINQVEQMITSLERKDSQGTAKDKATDTQN
jgi:hypothetical protein